MLLKIKIQEKGIVSILLVVKKQEVGVVSAVKENVVLPHVAATA